MLQHGACQQQNKRDSDTAQWLEKDASPPKRAKYSKVHPYAIISLFDGVGSAIPAITKAIGCAPRIIIAECDPILRQLVGEQFGLRTDGEWTQSSKDTSTRSMLTMCAAHSQSMSNT